MSEAAIPRKGKAAWLTALPSLTTRRWFRIVVAIVGIIIPMALATALQISHVPSFDGAMNLEVARNVASGGGYCNEYYGRQHCFPSEIQTSGPYIWVAALSIRLFGLSTESLQVANLVFILGLLVGVSWIMRRWLLAVLMAPTIILFGTPILLTVSSSGYGEGIVFTFAVWSIGLLAQGISHSRRSSLVVSVAFVLAGLSVTVKYVAAALVVVCVIAWWLYCFMARQRFSRFLIPAWVAAPVLMFEVYRLLSLGSFDEYLGYWGEMFGDIAGQAVGAGDEYGPKSAFLPGILSHLHILPRQLGVTFPRMLIILCGLACVTAVAVFAVRKLGGVRFEAVACSILAVYSASYYIWWLGFTPDEKAWGRRIVVGLASQQLASLLVIGIVCHFVASWTGRAVGRIVVGSLGCVVAVSVIFLAQGGDVAWRSVIRVGATVENNEKSSDSLIELSEIVRQGAEDGAEYYGWAWMRAPEVSLYSGVQMLDLSSVDPCFAAQNWNDQVLRFFVEDRAAKTLDTKSLAVEFDLVPVVDFDNVGGLYRIEPRGEACGR